jgi:glyoxylase-like metal-dependent hydrolase (beta-lactamase superfamily II)
MYHVHSRVCEDVNETEAAMPDMTTVRVGDARVTLLNAGDMRLLLSQELEVPEALWRPQYADLFEQPDVCPSLSVYIEHQGDRVLVDANDYRATMTPDSQYALPDYTPPPPIPDQLANLGVQPEDITHMVITHAHWDHYAGATTPVDSGYAPTYPQARYYLGAADWTDAEMQTALQDSTSLEARTLSVLQERGMLHLVAGPEQIAEGIDILPAPGETPGHQIVRVRSAGETLYIVGDVFHHPIEVAHPDWMVGWADARVMLATRNWLLQEALDEQALLTAAHIATLGRITRADGGGLRWSSEGDE